MLGTKEEVWIGVLVGVPRNPKSCWGAKPGRGCWGPCGPHPGLLQAFRQEGRAAVSKWQEKGPSPEFPSWSRRNRQSPDSQATPLRRLNKLSHPRDTVLPCQTLYTQTHHELSCTQDGAPKTSHNSKTLSLSLSHMDCWPASHI